MKYQILCFSPTGNTYFLANKLAKKLECNVINHNGVVNCEHLIIMSSIHAFRIPSFLKKKIVSVKKVSVIAVGCNTSSINDAAGYGMYKYVLKKKISFGIYRILAMPLTIVKKFDKEYGLKIINESMSEIDNIYLSIKNGSNDVIKVSLKSRILSNIHYIESLFVKLFGLELHANKKCIKCGLCMKMCPKKNIKMKDKPKFGLNCMMCMACIYKCPKRCIHPRISKFIEFKEGYNISDYLD